MGEMGNKIKIILCPEDQGRSQEGMTVGRKHSQPPPPPGEEIVNKHK